MITRSSRILTDAALKAAATANLRDKRRISRTPEEHYHARGKSRSTGMPRNDLSGDEREDSEPAIDPASASSAAPRTFVKAVS